MKWMISVAAAFVAATSSLLLGPVEATATTYIVTDLGPGIAFGINDLGQVVGDSFGVATVWSGGVATPLQALPGSSGSGATGINNAGQVSGNVALNGVSQAVMWNGPASAPVILGVQTESQSTGINNAGQVVGLTGRGGTDYSASATAWTGTTATTLGAAKGNGSKQLPTFALGGRPMSRKWLLIAALSAVVSSILNARPQPGAIRPTRRGRHKIRRRRIWRLLSCGHLRPERRANGC